MTTVRASLRALWCDQGMAHILATYDSITSQAPSGLALIDFGAETMFKNKVLKLNLAAPAVSSVINLLLLQAEAGLTPKLDYVLISHQDTDHWSLLNYLMDAVDELKLPMTVGKIIYGGADWGDGATKTVNRLATYGKAPVVSLKSNMSDYADADGEVGQLVTLGDVVLRILIANAPISKKSTPALRKNGTSAVVVIDFKSERMILPGDATWETLSTANKLLSAWSASPVQPVKLVSAPHHGSLDTMTPKNEGKDSNLEQLETFTELLKPEAVVASAGFSNSFKHPYLIILKVLGKYATPTQSNPGLGPHAAVVYMLNTGDWQRFEGVTKNVYTTVHGLTSPVPVADYIFTRSDFGFFTDAFGFFGPSKAMISVPTTSSQVLKMEVDDTKMNDDEDFLAQSGDEPRSSSPAIWLVRPRLPPRRGGPPAVFAPPPTRVAPLTPAIGLIGTAATG